MKIIIACGKSKENRPLPARQLYTGSVFKAAWAWAASVAAVSDIRIFSARYGLLHPMDTVTPYNLRMAKGRGVSPEQLHTQVDALGDTDLVGVLGIEYRNRMEQAGVTVRYPFCETLPDGRFGYLIQALKANMGRIPA